MTVGHQRVVLCMFSWVYLCLSSVSHPGLQASCVLSSPQVSVKLTKNFLDLTAVYTVPVPQNRNPSAFLRSAWASDFKLGPPEVLVTQPGGHQGSCLDLGSQSHRRLFACKNESPLLPPGPPGLRYRVQNGLWGPRGLMPQLPVNIPETSPPFQAAWAASPPSCSGTACWTQLKICALSTCTQNLRQWLYENGFLVLSLIEVSLRIMVYLGAIVHAKCVEGPGTHP